MRISIVGCGYIGRAAAEYWKNLGCSILVTTRHPSKKEELLKIADEVVVLTGPESFSQVVKDADAILVSVAPDSNKDYVETYLKTASHLAEALKNSTRYMHLMYIGSSSVYGEHQGAWVQENTPPVPNTPESIILLQTEIELLEISKRSEFHRTSIFRLGEILGPGREIQNRLRNHKGSFPGDGSNYTNLIHRDDILAALNFSIKNNFEGIYNLTNDLHITRKELYESLCRKYDLPFPVWDSSKSNPFRGNKRVCNTKIKTRGFEFLHPLAPLNHL